jgi:hypothetical protein
LFYLPQALDVNIRGLYLRDVGGELKSLGVWGGGTTEIQGLELRKTLVPFALTIA